MYDVGDVYPTSVQVRDADGAAAHAPALVCTARAPDGTTTTRFPMGEALDTAQPVVEYLPGWHCDITAARKWEDLPKEAQNYVEYLEKAVGCKITYISVGAEREAYIHHVV